MSDMRDAVGLRSTWKEFAETQYEFEPATGTLWGYMNQRGNPCFNLGLLKEIRSVGSELTANERPCRVRRRDAQGALPTWPLRACRASTTWAATWRCSCC